MAEESNNEARETLQANSIVAFWKKYLTDVEPCNFPVMNDGIDCPVQERSVSILLDASLQLQHFCNEHQLSLSDILQTAWAFVLCSYVGTDEACFSYLMFTDYGKEEIQGATGALAGMLIRRVQLTRTIPLIETLKGVQNQFLYCLPYQFRLASGIHHATRLCEERTFNTAVCLRRRCSAVLGSPTLQKLDEPYFDPQDGGLPMYDLLVNVVVPSGQVEITLDYRAPKISDEQAMNVVHTFRKVISSILASPDRMAGDLDTFSRRDKDRVWGWNGRLPRGVDSCVHQLVEQQTRICPRSPAIHSWDGELSYAKLEDLSTRLSHHLRSLGIGPEEAVPICFEKSMWAIVTMLGILKAGGACVPLGPSQPVGRLEYVIQDVRAKLVVTSNAHSQLFGSMSQRIVVVTPTLFDGLPLVANAPCAIIQPTRLAFIVYTSGSTGRPKGVMLEHRSVCTSARAHGAARHVGPSSRVLQFAAYTFDVSILDIFATLIHGGCICVSSEHDRLYNLAEVINKMMVNQVQLTPTGVGLLRPSDVPNLKFLSVGGEPIKPGIVTTWVRNVCLNNVYGPTECTFDCVGNFALQDDSHPMNIGRGIAALLWITDPSNHNRLAPVGSVGELLVEGPMLARGYLNQETETAAAFVENPAWVQKDGSGIRRRMYRTGDLVRYASDGSINFVGRKDSQIKLRGQRVEIGEIEYHLSKHPVAAISLVLFPKNGPYSGKLVAILQRHAQTLEVPTEAGDIRLVSESEMKTQRIEMSQISSHLKERLPEVMVPAVWIVIEKMPLLASAKINRKKVYTWLENLCLDSCSAIMANSVRIGPAIASHKTTALEISMKVSSLVAMGNGELQSRLKGQDFALSLAGMDSITSITLADFISQNYGVTVGAETLLKAGMTVLQLAEYVERQRIDGSPGETSPKLDIMREFCKLNGQLMGFGGRLDINRQQPPPAIRRVFVTGVTGYLGTQILKKLLDQPQIEQVIAHVRGYTIEHATQRLVKSAKLAKWWSDSFLERLEVWAGDLAQPELGLMGQQWRRISGNTSPDKTVDAIVHNGAAVYWNADYHTLKAVNVLSTVDLLNAATTSGSEPKLVYISGGHFRWNGESREVVAAGLASSNGYSQTKLISELLVEDVARKSRKNYHRFSVIKPGMIIGPKPEGLANVDDFLWRLVAGAVNIKGYDRDNAGSWLYISDSERVANKVVESLLSGSDKADVSGQILDGITVQEFWDVLTTDLGYDIQPMSHQDWIEALYNDIKVNGDQHPLWPFLRSLRMVYTNLGWRKPTLETSNLDKEGIKKAIRKNVEYLVSIGFLAKPDGERLAATAEDVFKRSRDGWVTTR
ncbi:MAG: putative NRPS-like protein biosynthetic cluster [Trichoglossum hirsutum]|nr:MAG: putative NRPS-like protein biosynthetic cluster [Trichoglossum hirsutum]